ncbi:MAG TPA: prepilin-type N-terminal cleavage/methylation domain-containing protein [Candidatus Angelobacter sp.]|nr:prepilin-type N-terminal cleavage/methylation domain-containing protein [Candidatus Angelobacter sp.]
MKGISNRAHGMAAANGPKRGYTLLELLIVLVILVTVTGAVFQQINAMLKKAGSEAAKLDMNQQAREFLDQTVRDLHMAGYPGASMYSNPSLHPSQVAAGLVRVSPTEILLEGDVNNDGNVYSVDITYVANDPNDATCPCIRRSAQAKVDADSFSQPSNPNYTETQRVFPPGTGAGQSGENLFAYYDQNGNAIDVGNGVDIRTAPTLIATIKTVKINLSLLTNQRDPASGGFISTSMSATSRLNQ